MLFGLWGSLDMNSFFGDGGESLDFLLSKICP